MDWIKADRVIKKARRIALMTHENPDGDGLGSAAAFHHYLNISGHDSRIIIHGKLPEEYGFLNKNDIFESYSELKHSQWLSGVDLVIVFDIGDKKRLNSIKMEVDRYDLPVMNIDHHPMEDDNVFTWNYVDTDASATGEMIFDYFKAIGFDNFSKEIYEGLYTTVLTDTGSFRYSNTTIKAHEIAIESIRNGVNHTKIYQSIYESKSHQWIRLLGAILSGLKYEMEGKLGWFVIDREILRETGAKYGDIEGYTDFVRTIKGVEVAVMIVENENETCRVNFRSKGSFVVNEVAKKFNGGGHKFAAGAVINGQIKDVSGKVISSMIASMENRILKS